MILIAVLTLAMPSGAWAAETRVTLEVVATDRFAVTKAQKWASDLGELGFASVRIRLADGERPLPEISGEPGDASRKVIGVLSATDELFLPGGRFRRGDIAGIAAWLKELVEGTPEEAPRTAFGLSAEELVELHTQLAAAVRQPTKDQAVSSVANALVRELPYPVQVSTAAKTRLADAEPVREELAGLSSGTSLAAVLRPLGLGLAPAKQERGIVLVVDDFRNLQESWPIGWPLQEKESDIVPKLLDFLPVEINKTPIADTVAAIAGRLELPVLYDHNALARHRIDPWTETSSLPETRTYYRRILDRTLVPAGLKAEVRLDEAEKPFLWISTVKP